MTQAITEILNNSLNTVLKQVSKTEGTDTSCMSTKKSFDSIIEKNQEKLNELSHTIGDLKTSKQSFNKLSEDFKAFLDKEIKSANNEKSLDLTLSQDIKNFISQLQNGTPADDSLTGSDNTEYTDPAVTIMDETNTAENMTDLLLTNSTLTMPNLENTVAADSNINDSIMDKLNKLEDIALQNVDLISSENDLVQTDAILNNNDTIDLLTNKLSETFSKLINNNTKSVQEPTVEEPEISDEMLKELNVESIESEADSSSQDYDLQQQTPEEHAIKAMISTDATTDFENDLSETQETTEVNTNSKETHTEKIIEQVTKQLHGLKESSKVDIVLNPEKLGKVSIHVAKSPEGMSAQFTVSTNEAKEILLKNLDGLKETLLSHGINADNVSVKMNESQKSEYKQDWTEQDSSENKNRDQQHHQQKEEKDKNIFEKMMAFINQDEMESI